jgi:hypothetical protein
MKRALLVLGVVVAALAQDATQKKDAAPPPKQDQPAPLFGGKLGVKSSKNTKESATLGFNGIDPSGKVDQKMLATTPTAADQAKVKQLSDERPKPAELAAFLKEGGLNQK